MLAMYGFHCRNIFGKKYISKRLQFGTILLPCKKFVTEQRTWVNKSKNSSFLIVFLLIPLINYPDDNTGTGTNDGKDASCNNKGTCDETTKMCTCSEGSGPNCV